MKRLLVLLALALPLGAETYQCDDPHGCIALYVQNGKLKQWRFRKNDIVDTLGGWVVTPDWGWKKIPNAARPPDVALIGLL